MPAVQRKQLEEAVAEKTRLTEALKTEQDNKAGLKVKLITGVHYFGVCSLLCRYAAV